MAYSRTLNHFTSMQELATIWASSTSYLLNQLVIENNFLYRCAVAHTSSGSFQTDLAAGNWERVSSAENGINWASSTYYVLNQLVIENDKLYKCLVAHTSSGSFITDLQAGDWVEISASEAGVFNYISNPAAEVDTSSWSTYDDGSGNAAPVDGAGAGALITWTRSISSPLRGDASFNFTKDAADRRGQGVSTTFTVDNADLAKVLTVTFDYEVLSGTYATGDLTVYLIQDPSGTPVVIQPAGYQIQSATVGTKVRQIATFQTASNVTSYRLCLHVASTSASAYTLAVDNVVVGPQVVQYGAPVTDKRAFTMVVTGTTTNPTFGTQVVNTATWRQVGDCMEISWQYRQSTAGTAGSGAYLFALPSGYAIDTSKLNVTGVAPSILLAQTVVGAAGVAGSGNQFTGYVAAYDSTRLYMSVGNDTINPTQFGSTTSQNFSTAAFYLSFTAVVPILGWSSSVVVSSSTDTRVVAARVGGNSAGQSLTANVTNLIFNTVQSDTHGAYNTSTGVFTAPVPGFYKIAGATRISTSATHSWSLFVDGVLTANAGPYITTQFNSLSAGVFLNAGQQLAIRCDNTVTVSAATGTSSHYLYIARESGPSAIAASETVAASYYLNANQAVTGNVTPINFNTKIFDTHGAVTTGASWRFTAPVAGKYDFVTVHYAGSLAFDVMVYKNGSVLMGGTGGVAGTPGTAVNTLDLLAGDYIEFRSNATGTIQGGLLTNNTTAKVHIKRVGN